MEEDYVVVGAEPFTFDMKKNDFDTITIATIAVVVLAIFVVLGLAYYVAYKNSMPSSIEGLNHTVTVPQNTVTSKVLNANSTLGSSRNGVVSFPGNCSKAKENCEPPYWGEFGEREAYSDNYIALGNPEPDDVTYEIIRTARTDRLSFGKSSCTQLCDNDDNCGGVVWKDGKCTLVTDVLVNDGMDLYYDPKVDSSLFIKKSLQGPIITDKVFIYKGKLPLRYWIQDPSNYSITSGQKGELFQVKFYPTGLVNDGKLTGVWSPYRFDFDKRPPSDIYVHKPGEELSLPQSWKGKILWTKYN